MPCPITVTKFVGTISLGLLTGVSYTLSTVTLPSLLTLPTAADAQRTVASVRALTKANVLLLSNLSICALSTAYVLSPRRFRHPYLLWTALGTLVSSRIGYGIPYLLPVEECDLKDGGEVNGEEVSAAVDRFKRTEWIRAGISGLAFAMCVVGIWGDRFGSRR